MLSEVHCNNFIRKSLNWGFKIPDSQVGKHHIKNCFDGFGIWNKTPIYWESKFFPEPVKRISHNDLFKRKHQVENLIQISTEFGDSPHLAMYCIFIRVASRKINLYIIRNAQLKEIYFNSNKSFTIEEIHNFAGGRADISTNLKDDNTDLWKILNLGVLK